MTSDYKKPFNIFLAILWHSKFSIIILCAFLYIFFTYEELQSQIPPLMVLFGIGLGYLGVYLSSSYESDARKSGSADPNKYLSRRRFNFSGNKLDPRVSEYEKRQEDEEFTIMSRGSKYSRIVENYYFLSIKGGIFILIALMLAFL